jgi:hypothetical protein
MLSEAEGDSPHRCATTAFARHFYECPRSLLPNAETFSIYGTLSLASSDRTLSFPRKSSADTE